MHNNSRTSFLTSVVFFYCCFCRIDRAIPYLYLPPNNWLGISVATKSLYRKRRQYHSLDRTRDWNCQSFGLCYYGQRHSRLQLDTSFRSDHYKRRAIVLFSGMGIATNYTWKEEAYELDVSVQVPSHVRAKDIVFAATSRSIDLRLRDVDSKNKTTDIILLDKQRPLRGKVNIDGTYWVIDDAEPNCQVANDSLGKNHRLITVTIEKIIKTPRDDFEIVDYDWKGVYAVEDDGEITMRSYDKPEPLDVREYAASLGVDIDNIDMNKVDKTMFGSNLNMTRETLNTLNDAGYLAKDEVTRQSDDSEYVTDEEGNAVQVSPLGEPILRSQAQSSVPSVIPFVDNDSPWNKTNTKRATVLQQTRNLTRAAFADDSLKVSNEVNEFTKSDAKNAIDPIDLLTVKKMKEILKSQGLKVSGSKKELQERLRSQVNALLQGKQGS